MISRPRRATSFATTALVLALPLSAQRQSPAQRGGPPRADTPQLVVGVLASSDPGVGVAAADAIRKRMQSEHNASDLYLTPRPTIDATLKSSGYNPDSALAPSDLLLLTKQLRGDYALTGTVERTATGMRTSMRLLAQRGQQLIAEPIAPVLGNDLADVAKKVDQALSEALRALAFHRDCMNSLVAGDYPRAMTVAQQGLKAHPASAAINQCLLATLRATHGSIDSIITTATAIVAVDSANVVTWAVLVDAYAEKGDTAPALDAARTLHRLEPANVAFTADLINRLVVSGQTESAVTLLDTALTASADNAALLRTKLALDRRLGRYASALATGKALIAADTSAATVEYFERQIGAAQAAHDTASVHNIALAASTRFPKSVTFLLMVAYEAVDRGSAREGLGLLERVFVIEPTNALAWQLAIAAHVKVDGIDSAVATARRAIATGIAKDSVAAPLIAAVSPALAAAQTSQKRADWEVVLRTAQIVDSVTPTARGSFYMGVAAYYIATDEVQGLSAFATKRAPTRVERQAACESATRAEAFVGMVMIALPKGGSVDPAIAGKILTATSGMTDFISSVKKASCSRREDSAR